MKRDRPLTYNVPRRASVVVTSHQSARRRVTAWSCASSAVYGGKGWDAQASEINLTRNPSCTRPLMVSATQTGVVKPQTTASVTPCARSLGMSAEFRVASKAILRTVRVRRSSLFRRSSMKSASAHPPCRSLARCGRRSLKFCGTSLSSFHPTKGKRMVCDPRAARHAEATRRTFVMAGWVSPTIVAKSFWASTTINPVTGFSFDVEAVG